MLTVIQLVGLDDLHCVVRYAAALDLQNQQHRVYNQDLNHSELQSSDEVLLVS